MSQVYFQGHPPRRNLIYTILEPPMYLLKRHFEHCHNFMVLWTLYVVIFKFARYAFK